MHAHAVERHDFFRSRSLVCEVYPAKVREEHIRFLGGIGEALMEAQVFRKNVHKAPSMLEYKSPTTLETPEIHTILVETDDPEGPFGELAPPFTQSWVEGPTALRVGDDYYVYFDCYTAHHYGAMKTRDWKNWEDVTSKLALPKGIRHGTTIEVDGRIIERLLAE